MSDSLIASIETEKTERQDVGSLGYNLGLNKAIAIIRQHTAAPEIGIATGIKQVSAIPVTAPDVVERVAEAIVTVSNCGYCGKGMEVSNGEECAKAAIAAMGKSLETEDASGQFDSANFPTTSQCRTCNGNDADKPCAYPGEGVKDCLRDQRLASREISVVDDLALSAGYVAVQEHVAFGLYRECVRAYEAKRKPVSGKLLHCLNCDALIDEINQLKATKPVSIKAAVDNLFGMAASKRIGVAKACAEAWGLPHVD